MGNLIKEILDLNHTISPPKKKDIIVEKITSLGACNFETKKVILNPKLATNPEFKYLRDKVAFHEWKHIVIFEKYGYSLSRHFINDISDVIKFFTDSTFLKLYFSPELVPSFKGKRLKNVEEKRPFIFGFGSLLYNILLIIPITIILTLLTTIFGFSPLVVVLTLITNMLKSPKLINRR